MRSSSKLNLLVKYLIMEFQSQMMRVRRFIKQKTKQQYLMLRNYLQEHTRIQSLEQQGTQLNINT